MSVSYTHLDVYKRQPQDDHLALMAQIEAYYAAGVHVPEGLR